MFRYVVSFTCFIFSNLNFVFVFIRRITRKKYTAFGFRLNFLFARIESQANAFYANEKSSKKHEKSTLTSWIFWRPADEVWVRLRWIIDAEPFAVEPKLAACSLFNRLFFPHSLKIEHTDNKSAANFFCSLNFSGLQRIGLVVSLYRSTDINTF